jgi:stearoyl-CoA desaturase (Delta-9 desaturase)
MHWFKRINLTVSLFLILTPIIAVSFLVYQIMSHQFHMGTLALAIVYTYVTGVAITAGYHRLFSHRAYKANRWVRLVFALLGSANFEGSVLEWCTDHRNHHLYTDTDRDPYSIKKGFWHAHMGWLFVLDEKKRDYSNVDDLAADPMLAFCHKYYVLVAIFMGFFLPMLIAGLWGDWFGGLFIAGGLRIVFNQQVTFCINSVCHIFGKKTYSEKQSACDNWVTALFTYGEGFHNYHHQFPLDYRNGVRFFHYDPAKWLIKFLSWFGFATDLKQMSQKRIIQYRVRLDVQRFLEASKSSIFKEHLDNLLAPVRDQLMKISSSVEELEVQLTDLKKNYIEMKHEKIEQVKDRLLASKKLIREYRGKLKLAKRELKETLGLWQQIIKTSEVAACQ